MASGDVLAVLSAADFMPATSSPASIDVRNGNPCWDFDAATDENVISRILFLPPYYSGGGITAVVMGAASSATSGNAIIALAFERIQEATTDLDADDFASAQSGTFTAPATNGSTDYFNITFTNGAQIDSVATGEFYRLKLSRDADNGSDTMSGDWELFGLTLKET